MKHITLRYNRTNISFEKYEFDEIGMFCELGQKRIYCTICNRFLIKVTFKSISHLLIV